MGSLPGLRKGRIMEEVFVGRQPILNKNQTIYGYELLFRAVSSTRADVTDDLRATASVMANTLNDIGFSNIVGEKKGFINVNEEILSNGFIDLLPKESTVLEILEDVEITSAFVNLCTKLKEKGYSFALDDFVYSEKYLPLFKVADYVKLDILMYEKAELAEIVKLLKKHSLRLLAEKVETIEDYNRCCDLGFELFQGYFFSKPTIVTGKSLAPASVTLLKLFNSLSKEEEIAIVEQLFKRNPQLDVKLLKFMNSASFYTAEKINSIRQAIMMLGYRTLQKWISLMLFAKNDDDIKSNPLLEKAAMRGLIMESLAKTITRNRNTGDTAFITGILSLTDVLLGMPFDRILKDLNLSKDISEALSCREGLLGKLLWMMERLEKEELTDLPAALKGWGLSLRDLLEIQTNAIMEFEHIENGKEN
jgi:c-di-GMP-related signal transduction protein